MMMIKAHEMTDKQLRCCSLKCPIPLPGGKGRVVVRPESGDYFCHPAKTELTKKFLKAAKEDLRLRQLGKKFNTSKFYGDFGRVEIGHKMFTYYPKSGFLVRDDFARWCEAHIHELWNFQLNCERLPQKDETNDEVKTVDPLKNLFSEARKRANNLHSVTEMLEPGSYNTIYDMKKTLSDYAVAIAAAERNDQYYVGTNILADQLAGTIAYREKHYADAIYFFINLAAAGLKAAQFIQEKAISEKETTK